MPLRQRPELDRPSLPLRPDSRALTGFAESGIVREVRGIGLIAVVAALTVFLTAAIAVPSPGAVSAQPCTVAQKTQRVETLITFRRGMAGQRRAFFRKTKSVKARRAFLARQQAQLSALQQAASCRVVPASADLTVSISVSGTAELAFTILVQNRGPGRATNVTLTDAIPQGIEFVSGKATAGRCSSDLIVTCNLKSLPSGSTVSVTISARRYRTGVIENSVSVKSATRDSNAGNNSATVRSSNLELPPSSSGSACSPSLTFPGERAYFHLGPTNYDLYLRATGRLSAVVLFVDFPDAPASEQIEPLFSAAIPPAIQWYSEGSYGRMTLTAERLNTWLRLPKPSVTYDLGYRGDYPGIVARHRTFLADAVAVADPLVDFGKYSTVLIVAGGAGVRARAGVPLGAGAGVVADGNELRGMVVMSSPLARPPDLVHEAGHLFGLPDLYDFSVPFTEGTRHLGGWDPMSNTGSLSHFTGWVKWKLGWLESSQIRCLTSPGALEETLSPIEAPGGVKMVVLPTSATTAEVIEVHSLRGLSSNQVCDSGVIVYSVDVRAPSGTAGARINPARNDAGTSQCGAIPRAAFDIGPGEIPAYEDGSLKLELVASDGNSYRVRVTRK